jgi:hypothetical protein
VLCTLFVQVEVRSSQESGLVRPQASGPRLVVDIAIEEKWEGKERGRGRRLCGIWPLFLLPTLDFMTHGDCDLLSPPQVGFHAQPRLSVCRPAPFSAEAVLSSIRRVH